MRKLKKSKMHRELTKNSLKIQHTILETIQNTRNMKKKKNEFAAKPAKFGQHF